MLIAIQLLAGIALLYYGAEWLVKGGVGIAARLGIPPLIIGLTLVSFATSAPELVVSVKAALAGSGDISIGNVVGSNICNVGLILGLSALITPLAVEKQLLKFDVPVLIAVSLLLSGLGIATGGIGRIAGAVFFLLLIGYVLCNVRTALKGDGANDAEVADEVKENRNMKLPTAFALVAVGLAALVGGAHLLVEGAVAIGDALGVSKAVIGLTVVAVGTSLPELATSVVAAIRHQDDIA
ncbi:calcium/sodium antiporter, partial [uncultured Victivallis sp.]|uniref:calcium/sodium antiporter n=1 Tax=uncultured Victivallis sp. TaxID=354118 RepID=UPI0025900EBF